MTTAGFAAGVSDVRYGELVARPFLFLYRCIPVQRGSLKLDIVDSSMHIRWEMCCCSCASVRIELEAVPKLSRQPICSWFRLIRDLPIAFLAAFLFHLIPSIIWGAEVSLGSPANHQLMGVVWFVGWPVWFLLFQLLRPWGLYCPGTPDGLGCTGTFIPFASHAHAKAVVEWWAAAADKNGASQSPPPLPPAEFAPRDVACTVVGLAVVIALVANALATAVVIQSCMSRGCCFDNATTLDSCRNTGYPDLYQ